MKEKKKQMCVCVCYKRKSMSLLGLIDGPFIPASCFHTLSGLSPISCSVSVICGLTCGCFVCMIL